MGEKRVKKSFHKKWWFWVIVAVVALGTTGCGGNEVKPDDEPVATRESNVKKDETKEEVQDELKEEKEEEKEYVNTAEEVELFTGEFIVGEDVKPGRYDIMSAAGTGNFFVYDGDMPIVNEILGNEADLGVTRIQVDLTEDNKIKISGIDKVLFKPAEIKFKTTLVSGNHLVGRDVPEGNYIVTAPEGSGNFFVYDKEIPVVNEILGDSDIGVEKIKISVKNGQMIVINGIEKVELSK